MLGSGDIQRCDYLGGRLESRLQLELKVKDERSRANHGEGSPLRGPSAHPRDCCSARPLLSFLNLKFPNSVRIKYILIREPWERGVCIMFSDILGSIIMLGSDSRVFPFNEVFSQIMESVIKLALLKFDQLQPVKNMSSNLHHNLSMVTSF